MHRIHPSLLVAITLCTVTLSSAALDAQVNLGKYGEVVGLTGHPLGPTLVRMNMDTCKNLLCRPGIATTTTRRDGGTAWDARRKGVWISSGRNLACVDPRTCKVICKQVAAPFAKLSSNARIPVVGGLAMDHAHNRLYMADAANLGIHQVSLRADCTFKTVFCSVRSLLPAGSTIGGLAIDNARRLLFVGSYVPSTGVVTVYVTPLESGSRQTFCLRRCDLTDGRGFPPQCVNPVVKPLRLTGLAFDSCRSMLYVTNGPWTTAYQFSKPGTSLFTCTVRALKCCNYPSKVLNDQFIGLAVLPRPNISTGHSCVHRNCGPCTSMIAELIGSPSQGNNDFAIVLRGAPKSSAPVFLGLGIGPCVSPGLNIGFCGRVLVTPRPIIVVALPTVFGTGACSARTRAPLPIPHDYSGCGLTVSGQFVMGCKSLSGGGNAVTNCVQFTINGG